jgi:hypothetical protein
MKTTVLRMTEAWQVNPDREHGRYLQSPISSMYSHRAISDYGVVRGGVITARHVFTCDGCVRYPAIRRGMHTFMNPQVRDFNDHFASADPAGTVRGAWTLVSRFRFYIKLRYVFPRNYGSEDRMNNFRGIAPYRWTPAVMLDPIREAHNDRLRGRCQRHVSSRK